MALPANRMVPRVARSTPEMARLSVDFPAPLAPRIATISPGATARSISRSTSVAPYPAASPLMARSGSAMRRSRHLKTRCRAMAEIGLDHPRIADHVLRRAFGENAAFRQYVDVLRKTHHRLHDVLDHHNG